MQENANETTTEPSATAAKTVESVDPEKMTEVNETIETLRRAECLADLEGQYQSAEEAAHAWEQAVHTKLEAETESWSKVKPSVLDSMSVRNGKTKFRVYGVVHGWTGGGSQAYRDFVYESVVSTKNLLCEKMLGAIYLGRRGKEIPDFTVLGILGQWRLAMGAMLMWPMFFYHAFADLLRERLRKTDPEVDTLATIIDSVRYHNLDPELRRAIGGDLPTRLQIEYEMKNWRSAKRYLYLDLLLCVVPRSAYQAEFARVWAEENNLDEVALLVGDRHMTEIAHFLRKPIADERILRAARRHAKWISRFGGSYFILFGFYMLNLIFGALLGALPWMVLALWITMQ